MEFRTELKVQKSDWELRLGHNVVSIGSCFADFISGKLDEAQFNVIANPFGIVYNPLSIFDNLNTCLSGNFCDNHGIVTSKGLFFSYKLHSKIFGESKEHLLSKMSDIQVDVKAKFRNIDYLIVTLGTALVYELDTDTVPVANCHKMPATFFKKRILEVDEIVESFSSTLHLIIKNNPSLKVIVTVSPVKHIKDTLVLNSISKSTLLLACHKISKAFRHNVRYFPAFEIVMDDLRDYRFYKDDLIHPNTAALQYIWEKFSESYFSEETRAIMREIESIRGALEHETLHPSSSEHEQFRKKIVEKVNDLNGRVGIPRLIEKVNLKFK